MNILHVCQNYYPSKGGPQYTLKHLSEKLAASYNDEVNVYTTNSLYNPESALYEKISPAIEVINHVTVHRLPFWRWHYPVLKFFDKALIKTIGRALPISLSSMRWNLYSPALKKKMMHANADVIMATTINYDFCNYPLWRKHTRTPKPFVIYGSLHLHREYNYNDQHLQKARNCDCYIANTDFERNELINKYGVLPHKIVTTGTGINADDFKVNEKELCAFKKKYSISDDDIVVGFVGRLVKGKGAGVLLGVMRKLAAGKRIKLLLAGASTDYVAAIHKAIHEEHLPIILIENFHESMKPLIYHAINIFAMPSQSESFGVVFLEAWSCRKPVIASRMGATASLLHEGEDALLADTFDADEWAQKINMLADNLLLQQRLAENGYKKTVQQFSWKAIVEKYRNAYLLGIENFKKEFL